MKKITYFNREIKDDIDVTTLENGFTDDCYEIKELTIEIADSDLDTYLNIINTSYAKYGEVSVEDGIEQLTELEVVQQQLFETQTELLETQAINNSLGSQLFDLQTLLMQNGVI